VQEIVVDVVGLQAVELFGKDSVAVGGAFQRRQREFRGDEHVLSQVVFRENQPECRLGTGVQVGGVKEVHASLDRRKNHAFGFGFVREPHTPEPENRQLVPFRIVTILHKITSVKYSIAQNH
jgi:hypothetical protein